MSETTQDIVDLIVINKDKSDNDILGLMIGQGVQFNKAKGILNSVLEEQGLRLTKVQRDEKAAEILEGFSVSVETTAEDVVDQIEAIVDEIDCTVNIARAYVRALFVAEDLPMPKAARSNVPRAPKVPGFRGDVKIAADYAIANPDATENDLENFKTFMDDNGGSTTKTGTDKSKKWHSAVEDLRIFAKAWKDAGNCN
ncbi:MAG: hypothetical protein GY756_03810 [bacterium]|nr:hypothetical protein [bacterium]